MSHKFSILYVDDEPSNLRIFRDTFRRKFNVHTALSAKEGIEILDSQKIDLVLSDQRMPEMTGVELLQYSLKKYPESNRILITGYTDFNAIEDAINDARIFQYVQKPWKEDRLLRIIENALRIYSLEQENKQQQAALIRAKEKAERSDRLKTEFLHNMSHEIRTPMNAIVGFTNLLKDDELSREDRNYFIDIIQDSSAQLMRIIDDILEISALETKHVRIMYQSLNLNKFLLQIYSVFKPQAEKKGLELKLERGLPDAEAVIISDESKLLKIINNLLENAVKFTETGRIEFGYKLVNNSNLEIYVKDTGIGVAKEMHEKIFERFSQEKSELSEKIGGLGLGLSIVKENVELLGGTLKFNSEKNKGTTFIIKLPYEKSKHENKSQNLQITSKLKASTILIAEDEDNNFLYLRELLKTRIQKLSLFHAKNGEEAVEICKENTDIDIVFMDIKMPILNGYEAAKKIRNTYPDLPIIAQTAYSTDEDIQAAKAYGCSDFISKPLDEEKINQILNQYLN